MMEFGPEELKAAKLDARDEMLYHDVLHGEGRSILPGWIREEARREMDKYVEMRCFRAMSEIKAVLDQEDLDDPECFQRIEAIVGALERIGSGSDFRHDF